MRKDAFMLAIVIGAIVGWIGAVKGKPQSVRLLDVAAVGPLMIYAGKRSGSKNANLLLLLVAFGAATITFNGRNYLEIRDLGKGGDGEIDIFR